MSFVRCTERLPYVTQLAQTMVCYAGFHDEEFSRHCLNKFSLLRAFGRQLLLQNCECSLKKTVIQRRLRLK